MFAGIGSKLLPIILALLAVSSIFFYISNLHKRVESLDQANKVIIADNVRKKAVLDELIRRDENYSQITVKFDQVRRTEKQQYDKEIKEIENAKEEDDKPVGPILSEYLNSLQ